MRRCCSRRSPRARCCGRARPLPRSRRRSAPRRPARLVRLAKDVGRVGEKAGTRGALDTLRIAEGPKDVARAARLAESKGGQTRAILKTLGRGALLLAAGAFNLTMWVFGALLALFGFLSSIKATTERVTLAWLRRKKARRLRKQIARQQACRRALRWRALPRKARLAIIASRQF